ncbi:uncharacterized protein [Arachis hypogaea]|uniref:uncharacterized protein n=1 Tax=Arachis hypogaea TaxID=3818 RepID=UPI003B2147B4
MDSCGLMDMGTKGRKFTWHRRVKGGLDVAKKLDRAFLNEDWCLLYPETFCEILGRYHFDHAPILVTCNPAGMNKRKKNHPFIFQAAWTTHPLFHEVVHKAWDSGSPDISKSLTAVKRDAQKFNSEVFGNIFVTKRELEQNINRVQVSLESCDDLSLREEEKRLQQELNSVLFKRGDLLEVDFSVLNGVPLLQLSQEACKFLSEPVSIEEVRRTVMEMNSFKAPGPDGFQAIFFKEYWDVVGRDVWKIVCKAFAGEV